MKSFAAAALIGASLSEGAFALKLLTQAEANLKLQANVDLQAVLAAEATSATQSLAEASSQAATGAEYGTANFAISFAADNTPKSECKSADDAHEDTADSNCPEQYRSRSLGEQVDCVTSVTSYSTILTEQQSL